MFLSLKYVSRNNLALNYRGLAKNITNFDGKTSQGAKERKNGSSVKNKRLRTVY